MIRGDNEERKHEIGSQRGNGKDQKSKGSNSSRMLPSIIDFCRTEIRVLLEDRVDVKLANVSRNIKEERKPANPIEKLNFAYPADLQRKTLH